MAIVITNGNYFICYSADGGIRKTKEFEEAVIYESVSNAIQDMKKAPSKTEKYYVFDTVSKHICWKWLTDEEKMAYERNKVQQIKKKKKSAKRKSYSQSVRKMIYNNADGCCQLCGRKIKFEDMTLDHIQPLGMNGADCISNLQCTCREDNLFKGSIEPEAFLDRITTIFMYQMEKKYADKLSWKIVHKLLQKMI